MKFLIKFEDQFNTFVFKATVYTRALLKRLVPKYYQRKYERRTQAVEENKITLRQRIRILFMRLIKFSKDRYGRVKSYDLKAKFAPITNWFKSIDFKNPKKIKANFNAYLQSLSERLAKIPPKKVAIGIVSVLLFGVSVIAVYSEGSRLASRTSQFRSPASAPEIEVQRKPYHKEERKQMIMNMITLPVHFVNINQIRKTDIEFTITSSNRHIQRYLLANEFRLRDHLFMTVEPVVPEFPLTEEGKEIIKEKIQKEINHYLNSQKIEGAINEVDITYILSV